MMTFETAKELNRYVKIETERYINKDNKEFTKHQFYNYKNNVFESDINIFPVPSLEELLKASPININVEITNNNYILYYNYENKLVNQDKVNNDCRIISKSESLNEAVAKIIIEYYKQKEKRNDLHTKRR